MIHLTSKVSIGSIFFEARFSFKSIGLFLQYFRFELLIDQIFCSYWDVLIFILFLSGNYSFGIFEARSNLPVKYCKMFLRWIIFWLFPLDWTADRLTVQKHPTNFLVMSIFKLVNLWSCRYEIFRHCLHRGDVFCPFWIIFRSDLLCVW